MEAKVRAWGAKQEGVAEKRPQNAAKLHRRYLNGYKYVSVQGDTQGGPPRISGEDRELGGDVTAALSVRNEVQP